MAAIPIEIITTLVDRVSGASKKITQKIQDMGHGVEEVNEHMTGFDARGRKIDRTMKRTTTGMKKFSFEWLSVMFLGMAINKIFGTYIKQTLDMLGVTELFLELVKYLVFTALEPFLDILFGIIAWFFDLPEGVQKALGWFIILMGVLSMMLMYFAMMKLGLMGLGNAFPILGKIGALVTGKLGMSFLMLLGKVALVVAGIVLIIWGIIDIIRFWGKDWKKVGMGIAKVIIGIGLLLALFLGPLGWIGLIVIAFGAAVFLIIKYWDKIKAFFIKMWHGLVSFFKSKWVLLLGPFGLLVYAIVKHWDKIKEGAKKVWEFIKKVFDKIKGLITGQWLIGGIGKLFGGKFGDFIWRPGSPPIEVSPRDTIVGFKGPGPAGATVNFAPVYNITVADKAEFEALIKQDNVRLVEDLRRLIQT